MSLINEMFFYPCYDDLMPEFPPKGQIKLEDDIYLRFDITNELYERVWLEDDVQAIYFLRGCSSKDYYKSFKAAYKLIQRDKTNYEIN